MHVRKLFPSEAVQLSDHLIRLSDDERSLRFMGYLNEVAVAERCARVDWRHTVVIGGFDACVLRGAAELVVLDKEFPVLCEVAITVEKAWQEQGVATELLRRALVIARNRSARGVQVNCFSGNHRIQHVAEKFGAKFLSKAGESEAQIPTLDPTYWSVSEEWINDGLGWMGTWCDQAMRGRGSLA